jgi:hypothetical protein
MADVNGQGGAALAKARDHLEQALSELESLFVLDPSAVAFAAHALNNYLAVAGNSRVAPVVFERASGSANPHVA